MPRSFLKAAAALSTALLATQAASEDVIVMVAGVEGQKGDVACRLYNSPRNFPFGRGTAGEDRTKRAAGTAACVFRGLAPGNYALVVALLPEGQADITRDFLGRPRQPWGVSNNIRQVMRPPRFHEAAFTLEGGKSLSLTIALAK